MQSNGNSAPIRRDIIIICLCALMLRGIFILFPSPLRIFSDMEAYHAKARLIVEEGAYRAATRPPLYPFMLAAVYKTFGEWSIPVRSTQALLGTVVCLLTYFIAYRLCGRRGARLAGLLVACYPSLVIYTCFLMSENLFIPLLVASLWMMLSPRMDGKAHALFAGVILGLACLTRSVLAGFIPLAALWLRGTRVRLGAFLFLLGALLTIAPWTIRNYRYHHTLVPIDMFGGYNFLIGNNPDATGRQDLARLYDLAVKYWNVQEPGSPDSSREWVMYVDPAGSTRSYREGLGFIAAHPRRFLTLGIRKLGYLYGLEIRELSWAYSKDYFGAVPARLLIPVTIATLASFPLLVSLALTGLFLRTGNNGGAWALLVLVLLYFSAAHVMTFGESRFHLPLVPVLAVCAGRLIAPGNLMRRMITKGRLCALLIICVILCVSWIRDITQNRHRLNSVCAPGGNSAEFEY
ncbi:MAG: glycosyltransferase family 39 protein [Candidatus Aureabacteria bacterium]|nr:glycosyltransferase family 39 protein [Candidatus Auribacterota bacterium]